MHDDSYANLRPLPEQQQTLIQLERLSHHMVACRKDVPHF